MIHFEWKCVVVMIITLSEEEVRFVVGIIYNDASIKNLKASFFPFNTLNLAQRKQ